MSSVCRSSAACRSREIELHARLERVVERTPDEVEGALEVLGGDTVRAELLRHDGVEAAEGRVYDLPAEQRIGLGVDLLRIDHTVDEPGRGAVRETLELGCGEDRPRGKPVEHRRARQLGRSVEGGASAVEPARPSVRRRERVRIVRVVDGQSRNGTQTLALARRSLERPGQARERPPARGARDVACLEECANVVPERARLPRDAVVGRRLADEHEPLRRPRARRVEQVAAVGDGVRELEAPAERPPGVVVQEGRRPLAPREASLLESEEEDDVEDPRARSTVVEDGDAPDLARGERANGALLERRNHILCCDGLAIESRELRELVEHTLGRAERVGVSFGVVVRGRRLEAPGMPHHRAQDDTRAGDVIGRGAQLDERGYRRAAEPLGLLLDARGVGDGTAS